MTEPHRMATHRVPVTDYRAAARRLLTTFEEPDRIELIRLLQEAPEAELAAMLDELLGLYPHEVVLLVEAVAGASDTQAAALCAALATTSVGQSHLRLLVELRGAGTGARGRAVAELLDAALRADRRRPPVELPHACDLMRTCVEDVRVAIDYFPAVRAYAIPVAGSMASQTLESCPFCGERLPPSLHEEHGQRLLALGLEPFLDPVPPPYDSDEWWRAEPTGS